MGPAPGLHTPPKLVEPPSLTLHLDSAGEWVVTWIALRGQVSWCSGRGWRPWAPLAGPGVFLPRGQRRAATVCLPALASRPALGERQLRPTLAALPPPPGRSQSGLPLSQGGSLQHGRQTWAWPHLARKCAACRLAPRSSSLHSCCPSGLELPSPHLAADCQV